VRSLAELGWFLSAGTAAQLFALGVVAWRLANNPVAGAATRLVATGGAAALAPALIAFMNIVFACALAPRRPACSAAVLPNGLLVLFSMLLPAARHSDKHHAVSAGCAAAPQVAQLQRLIQSLNVMPDQLPWWRAQQTMGFHGMHGRYL